MDAFWISISFFMSLLTNVIVFLGMLSLIFWVSGNDTNPFVAKHQYGLQLTIFFTFESYLLIESLISQHLGPNAYGRHWSFTNLIIIAYFIFGLIRKSRLHAAVCVLATLAYFLLQIKTYSPLLVGLLFTFLSLMYWLGTHGHYLIQKRWLSFIALAAFAAAGIACMTLTFPTPTDTWFWVRQVAAFVIISLAVSQYAVSQGRRNAELSEYREEATRDALTSIKNMGSFTIDLTAHYADFLSTGARYGLYELDIDHFKHINDTYGHLTGNEVLQQVAAVLRELAKEQHQADVYRMGGEEFGILVHEPAAGTLSAGAVGTEINRRIRALSFTAGGQTFRITVSIGLAVVAPEDNNYLDIYSRADQNLYLSKESGRNALTYAGKTQRFA